MFEIGRSYRITTGQGDWQGYSSYTVTDFQFPLLKVEAAGIETIFNTSSPTFVMAEKELTQIEREARMTELPDYLKPAPASSR